MSVKRYRVGYKDSASGRYAVILEKQDGGYVKYEDYAALEARCAALAAELNAVLTDRAVILEDLDKTCFEIGMQRGEKVAAYPAPTVANHDAFLDEVRSSAVDEVCLKISKAIINCYQDEQVGLDAAATICGDFASEIRKGVQS